MMEKTSELEQVSTDYELITSDSLQQNMEIDDHSVQLVITSPPYNIGKEYERGSQLNLTQYLDKLEYLIKQLWDKISDSGSICWQSGNYVQKGEIYPLDAYFYQIFKSVGFKLRNRIIWRFNFGLNATKRFSGRYETILWFTKGDDYLFNLDPIRVPQLYPGKRHSSKKGVKAGQPSGNPLGKNPSDYWEFSADNLFFNDPVWDIPNVKANHPEKTIHPCQFPVELAERCVLGLTRPGDLVLDPFVGAGSSIIAALKHNRRAIGIDNNSSYTAMAKERARLFQAGELRLRPSGKETSRPRTSEKVATVPVEWNN